MIRVKNSKRNYRGVARTVGAVVTGLGSAILLCAIVGGAFYYFSSEVERTLGGAEALAATGGVTIVLGLLLYAYGRKYATTSVSRREAVLSVALIWLAAGVFGGMPFVIGADMAPSAAFFEAISGFTTTGSTVITDIEARLSWPLLLWRSLIQWLGGMGIVVLFVAIFPNIGAGAKHMFRGEVPGTTAEGLKPRIAETSFTLWKIYLGFTVLETVILKICGMSWFEAICHSFTTMATGGFSTRDASVAAFDSAAIDYTISAFMLIASVNFALYYAAIRGRSIWAVLRSVELRAFALIVLASIAVVTIGTLGNHDNEPLTALRYSVFQVATFVSSTGAITDDYMAYPSPILGLLILLMFMGGCSGSTAGGIKVERIILLAKQLRAQVSHSFRPAVVRVIRMDKQVVDGAIMSDVAAFFVVYMATIAGGVLFVTAADGVPLPTAFGAVLTCISNSGPSPFYLEGDHFANFSPMSKIVFSMVMLLGRLEFFTLLALLTPEFWRR